LFCYVGPQLDHPPRCYFFLHRAPMFISLLVVISPSERTLPARMTMDLIRRLQFDVVPQM
jgi:hypothetical protein